MEGIEGRKKWEKNRKSFEDEEMNGGTETSPNGETSAKQSQMSFVISSKKEEQRGAECRPLMEG